MGWDFGQKPYRVKEYFEQRFAYTKPNGDYGKLIAFAMRGWTVAYGAYETCCNGKKEVTGLAIQLRFTRNGEMGVKDISEEMGPCDRECPSTILKLLTEPAPNDYAKQWRETCWKNVNARKAIKLNEGAIVEFKEPLHFTSGAEYKRFTVVKTKPLRFQNEGGNLCRLRRKTIAQSVADGTATFTPGPKKQKPPQPIPAIFNLGQVVITQGAEALLRKTGLSPLVFLNRHGQKDWGDVGEEDQVRNNEAVQSGDMVLSSYKAGDEKIWIITDAGHSGTEHNVTTALLPDEY